MPAECTIVLLAAKDEEALIDLLFRAGFAGIGNAGFWEPDLNDRLTAIALGSQAEKLCRHLPLLFGEGVRSDDRKE